MQGRAWHIDGASSRCGRKREDRAYQHGVAVAGAGGEAWIQESSLGIPPLSHLMGNLDLQICDYLVSLTIHSYWSYWE